MGTDEGAKGREEGNKTRDVETQMVVSCQSFLYEGKSLTSFLIVPNDL